jgi:hypothetical protein
MAQGFGLPPHSIETMMVASDLGGRSRPITSAHQRAHDAADINPRRGNSLGRTTIRFDHLDPMRANAAPRADEVSTQ